MVEQSFSSMYSRYYDLLYKDKNYKKESEQIDRIIRLYSPEAKSILNIGSGTGGHDINFAQKGYEITGIDSSVHMLEVANKKKESGDLTKINYLHKDIRKEVFAMEYDVVLSLFHVVSYLTEDEDLHFVFENVYKSLKKGGIFIFDFWYAEGVLASPPEKRTKVIEENDFRIERISESEIYPKLNQVVIEFILEVKNKKSGLVDSKSREVHKVRYFFLDEIHNFLKLAGFEILNSGSDYEFKVLNEKDRYATVLARK